VSGAERREWRARSREVAVILRLPLLRTSADTRKGLMALSGADRAARELPAAHDQEALLPCCAGGRAGGVCSRLHSAHPQRRPHRAQFLRGGCAHARGLSRGRGARRSPLSCCSCSCCSSPCYCGCCSCSYCCCCCCKWWRRFRRRGGLFDHVGLWWRSLGRGRGRSQSGRSGRLNWGRLRCGCIGRPESERGRGVARRRCGAS